MTFYLSDWTTNGWNCWSGSPKDLVPISSFSLVDATLDADGTYQVKFQNSDKKDLWNGTWVALELDCQSGTGQLDDGEYVHKFTLTLNSDYTLTCVVDPGTPLTSESRRLPLHWHLHDDPGGGDWTAGHSPSPSPPPPGRRETGLAAGTGRALHS